MNTWWKYSHSWSSGYSGILFSGSTSWSGCVYTYAPAAYPKSCSLPGWGQNCWLSTELERWSLVLELTAARSHVVFMCWRNRQHNVTSVRVTAVGLPCNAVLETEIFCHRFWRLITPQSSNIFQQNLLVLSQIYSESTARNFVRMCSDLAFRPISCITFFRIQCIHTDELMAR